MKFLFVYFFTKFHNEYSGLYMDMQECGIIIHLETRISVFLYTILFVCRLTKFLNLKYTLHVKF